MTVGTAESKAITSNDAGLNDGVLLWGEGVGVGGEAESGEEGSPRLEEEEAEQAGGDVEGRDDPNGDIISRNLKARKSCLILYRDAKSNGFPTEI